MVNDDGTQTETIATVRTRRTGIVVGLNLEPGDALEWVLSWTADVRLGLPRGTVQGMCEEGTFRGELYPQYRNEDGVGGLFAPPLVWWVRIADVDAALAAALWCELWASVAREVGVSMAPRILDAADRAEVARRLAKLSGRRMEASI